MGEFDYGQFACSYLAKWADERRFVKQGLTKIDQAGFAYDDDGVDLESKHFLSNILNATRVGDVTVVMEFGGIPSTRNSECGRAVEDYLRVLFCERGYASDFTEATVLLADISTEFHGLITEDRAPVNDDEDYKALHVSLNTEDEDRWKEKWGTEWKGVLKTIMSDSVIALDTLVHMVGERRNAAGANPQSSAAVKGLAQKAANKKTV